MRFLPFILILLLFSCSKKYKTKNYLVGEWKLEKISYVNAEAFEYKYIPTGTIEFTKIDDFNYSFQLTAEYPNDTIAPFSDEGLLTFDSKFKSFVYTKNGIERYSAMPLLTKDELMFDYSATNFFCKIVAGK